MMRFIVLLLLSRPAKEPFRHVKRSAFEFTFSDALKRLESARATSSTRNILSIGDTLSALSFPQVMETGRYDPAKVRYRLRKIKLDTGQPIAKPVRQAICRLSDVRRRSWNTAF
ncbi:hypothetical protein N7E02_16540 [Aliirhizobium terrae]|uniref:hypothetical protein n=1 Tax=Terrirhizobium terrae TaxID=2926709 RepID=UPI00257563B0|nr:hypothetical protein [Rhizobium sp. CC-CFT758]WJH41849.1 hypothetical protein N7E02_16540 [Rhizobium sp. CC-CFT758]